MGSVVGRNKVRICGQVISKPEFVFESFGMKFYDIYVRAERASGNKDTLIVRIPQEYCAEDIYGEYVEIIGKFYSHNKKGIDHKQLQLYVFAYEMKKTTLCLNENEIELEGFVCKMLPRRATPGGRYITDFFLAVNRSNGKSDYIPCIAWGNTAKQMEQIPVGARISLKGRIQSRDYIKKYDTGELEPKTAYEVSVRTFLVIEWEGN